MRHLLIACTFLLSSTWAAADRLPLPNDAPPAFAQECGSCHLPYPPQLLTADDWQRLMQGLDKHFGADATLDHKTAQSILTFLQKNAGTSARYSPAGDPPRVSRTPWFQREHGRLSLAVWKRPAVRSPANCEACHRQAAKGSFSEREIVIPGGER